MKRILKNAALMLLISVLVVSSDRCTNSKKYKFPFQNPDLSFEERAADMVSKMTIEQKISQMQHGASAIDSLGIPAYNWWNESLHGLARAENVTVFPQVMGMSATFDPELINKEGDITSSEARALYNYVSKKDPKNIVHGLTFWAPNINIFRDPRWGRGQETYGEDPYLTSIMGVAFVKGLQGNDPKYLKVVSTPKHFAVHSGPESSRHRDDIHTSKRDLYETYLPAFEATVRIGGAYSIMGAYNSYNGIPCCANNFLLNDILRKKWGFKGYVVSDCGAIGDIYNGHHFAKDEASAAAVALKAGLDLSCIYGDYLAINDAIKKGLITEKEIDISVTRLMLARLKLGMFDPPEMVPYSKIPFTYIDSKENRETALQVAKESMVLLKNQNNILPLDKSKIKSIAVIGPNANNVDVLHGNYNGEPSKSVTVFEGIKLKSGADRNVYYTKGCDLITPDFKCAPIPEKNLKGGLKGEYFNNMNMEGTPVMVRTDNIIDFDWQADSPDPKVHYGGFSVRWTGKLMADKAGDYEIAFTGDDGYRVYINNKEVIECWDDKYYGAIMKTYKMKLIKGQEYDLKIEYYQNAGGAVAKLGWIYPGAIEKYRKDYEKQMKEEAINAKKLAAKSDVIVFVGGISSTLEGEEMVLNAPGFSGGDRTTMDLTELQENLLKELHALNKPIILVLMNGSALSINWEKENIPAIVEAWYPGEEGGTAVADVLFGDYNPAGRLPITFYKSVNDLPPFEDYNMNGRTYRYFKGTVLYPFGFGLSYTKFDYSDLKLSKNDIKSEDSVIVSVNVKNSGNYDGDEVVQLYVKNLTSKEPQPLKALKGFKRVNLKKGELKTVQITLKAEALKYFDEQKNDFTIEPGKYDIQIGASSEDIRQNGELRISN